jgi:hypothetical protein
METKNLKSIEWHCDELGDCARLRIVTKETNRARVFVVYNVSALEGYTNGMDVYNDWAMLESSCCYKSLISVFTAMAEILDCDFAELAETMVEIDKLLA